MLTNLVSHAQSLANLIGNTQATDRLQAITPVTVYDAPLLLLGEAAIKEVSLSSEGKRKFQDASQQIEGSDFGLKVLKFARLLDQCSVEDAVSDEPHTHISEVSGQDHQTHPTPGGPQSNAPPSSAMASATPSLSGTPYRELPRRRSAPVGPDHSLSELGYQVDVQRELIQRLQRERQDHLAEIQRLRSENYSQQIALTQIPERNREIQNVHQIVEALIRENVAQSAWSKFLLDKCGRLEETIKRHREVIKDTNCPANSSQVRKRPRSDKEPLVARKRCKTDETQTGGLAQ